MESDVEKENITKKTIIQELKIISIFGKKEACWGWAFQFSSRIRNFSLVCLLSLSRSSFKKYGSSVYIYSWFFPCPKLSFIPMLFPAPPLCSVFLFRSSIWKKMNNPPPSETLCYLSLASYVMCSQISVTSNKHFQLKEQKNGTPCAQVFKIPGHIEVSWWLEAHACCQCPWKIETYKCSKYSVSFSTGLDPIIASMYS